jgi:sialic acid synthase SpsE
MKLKIISEIGINHNGDFRLIEELVRQSKIGGADFAKFQIYNSVRVFGDDSRKHNELSFDQVKVIKQICDSYGIEFFASVFDENSLSWCLDLGVKYLKIASRTLVKEPILTRQIIDSGLTTFVSLGQWNEDQVPHSDSNVYYFNCKSKYPTSILDIKQTSYRPYRQEKIVGLSDHSYGIANCLHHISHGAEFIEKHFTLSKASPGPDHIGSMDLAELRLLRELGDQISLVSSAMLDQNKSAEKLT